MRIAFIGDSLTQGIPGCSYFAILRARLPGHTLVNLGQGNDTVISLYRRISRLHFDTCFDIAFLWVGVNDVADASSCSFEIVNALLNKPRAQSLQEFRQYYQATLDLLGCHARRIIAVSPLLKGENPHSAANRELGVLAHAIEGLALANDRVEYLDVRTPFLDTLANESTSDYLPRRVIGVALDALTLHTRQQIDRRSAGRGLYLTLDGIHLNGAGADKVADLFLLALNSKNA